MTMQKNLHRKNAINALRIGVMLALLPSVGLTQNNNNPIEEVYVTGSSIKRSDLDGALPVQIISADAIASSGVSNVSELVAKLPAMQGFVTASDTVGGGGGGIKTANLRDLGSQYTLILLNGRRLASADDSSQVDLSNIPISAIERVEILTDGASAVYGSDAIAGVVNFILKSSFEGFAISGRTDRPAESGGSSSMFDISGGFGDLNEDGFNIVLSLSHDSQEQLAAVDRDFAKSGIIEFMAPGFNQKALFFNGSGNSIPGNARVKYAGSTIDPETGLPKVETVTFSPYKLANGGACPAQTSAIDNECWFDYTSTIEILPEYARTSFFAHANAKLGDNLTAFMTVTASSNEVTSRIAPYPSGWVRLPNDSVLATQYVLPNLTDEQRNNLISVDGRWRALPANNRTAKYATDAHHFVTGLDGNTGKIDYSGALTVSTVKTVQDYPTGWLIRDPFIQAVSSGAIDIFAGQGALTEEQLTAVAQTVYNGNWDTIEVEMIGFDAKASMPVFEISGGEAKAAVGMDVRSVSYKRSISAANANEDLLFLSKDTPYEMDRTQFGLFSELWLPITDSIESTIAIRYDEIGAVYDEASKSDLNSSESDVTYKIDARWNITDTLALRASYGTGFKAPSMREIGEPRSDFGVTSGSYACPFATGDALRSLCLTGDSQYGTFREGNTSLTPETSTQYTYGMVYSPSAEFSIIADYWNIEMKDLVERLTEQQIFQNPTLYRDTFTSRLNLSTNENELAIIQAAVNAGSSQNSGIDYAINKIYNLDFGELTTGISGTYFIESDSSLTGSSLGKFGNDNSVTFRNIIQLSAGLTHGMFEHSVTMNYRSGYSDQQQEVTLIEDDGSLGDDVFIQLHVSSYTTVDYQLKTDFYDDSVSVTIGAKNLFDKTPPLSLRTGGSGHQVGWDPRYSDPYGRTIYLQAKYTFK